MDTGNTHPSSQPLEEQPHAHAKIPKWRMLHFALAALNLVAVITNLALSRNISNIFSDSLRRSFSLLIKSASSFAMVASISSLADNLGIQAVAEGNESENIVGPLQSIPCDWGQGYSFAKPITKNDAEEFIAGTCMDTNVA